MYDSSSSSYINAFGTVIINSFYFILILMYAQDINLHSHSSSNHNNRLP